MRKSLKTVLFEAQMAEIINRPPVKSAKARLIPAKRSDLQGTAGRWRFQNSFTQPEAETLTTVQPNASCSALDERCCATGAEVFPLARELTGQELPITGRRRRPVALEPFRTWTAHVMQLRPITPSESSDDSPHECQDIHPLPPLEGPHWRAYCAPLWTIPGRL